MLTMHSLHLHQNTPAAIVALFIVALAGCASQLPAFTEHHRHTIGEQDLQSLSFAVSTPIVFKSLRVLDPVAVKDKNIFSPSGHRFVELSDTATGRLVEQGEGTLIVDFGRGLVLTFARRSSDGIYATAGWGTYTIEGERYDIVVGIISGNDIELRVKQYPLQ